MTDLLYVENDEVAENAESDIKKKFPEIVCHRVYDDIHGTRIEISSEHITLDEWFRFLEKLRCTSMSLSYGLNNR